MSIRVAGLGLGLLIIVSGVAPAVLAASTDAEAGRLSLDQALELARRANAELPVAAKKVEEAEAQMRAAKGALYPSLSLVADLHGGTPQKYASNDALLQLAARIPIYDGGLLRADMARSRAQLQATRAGYRKAVRDVDYAVRVAYGGILRARETLDFRRRAIERLERYLSVVAARRASGQGVGADVLQIRQRLASAKADVATVTRDLHESRMTLNDLLGRAPDAPLSLASLPAPAAPPSAGGEPWLSVPGIVQAEQEVRASEADVEATHAGRRAHVAIEANVGSQPDFDGGPSPLNNGTGEGAEVLVTLTLPLWDKGVYRGRMAAANAALGQAQQRNVLARRAARLAWMRAVSDLADLLTEYEARDAAGNVARDAWLQAESLYRGGQSTALAVLDAYDAWIAADQSRLDVIYNFRVAQAQLERWGAP